MNISERNHRYFNDYLQAQDIRDSDVDINTAVTEYLVDKGFTHPSQNYALHMYFVDLSLPFFGAIYAINTIAEEGL